MCSVSLKKCPFAFLHPYQKRVEEGLLEKIEAFKGDEKLKESCAYALLNGGKRFRPSITLLIADLLGNHLDVLDGALAIEYFHTASLVADDLPCMDDEQERRGKPALHILHGEALSLLTTYSLIAEGYALVGRNARLLKGRAPDSAFDALAIALENVSHNTGMGGASGGQLLDIAPPSLDRKTAFEMVHQKTAALFEISFVFGWLFGGGEPAKLPLVKKGAHHFGTAFQLADDLDDIEEDAAMGRTLNLALVLGEPQARQRAKEEINQFLTSMGKLSLTDSCWHSMAEALLSS